MKNDRIIIHTEINSKLKLEKFKSEGLTPYYFNDVLGKNFGLIKIVSPLTGRDMDRTPKRIFLLTDDEYSTMEKLVNNLREMIELTNKKIGLLKDLIPATMNTLMNKTDEGKQ